MKKFLLGIFMLLNTLLGAEQITPIHDMQQVFDTFKDTDSRTLAVFDVDMVLVQPTDPAFQMANMKRYSAISKRILNAIQAEKQVVFFSLMTITSPSMLIDEKTPKLLNQITLRGIPSMALTANLTGRLGAIKKMEQWRIEGLKKLGIDFSKSAPCSSSFIFDHLTAYRGHYSTYLDGVLFVNGSVVSKGEALIAFFEKSNFIPRKVVFIDDREENLKNVQAALQKFDPSIEYNGLHYLGAQKYPSTIISESEFESKWQELANQALEVY